MILHKEGREEQEKEEGVRGRTRRRRRGREKVGTNVVNPSYCRSFGGYF